VRGFHRADSKAFPHIFLPPKLPPAVGSRKLHQSLNRIVAKLGNMNAHCATGRVAELTNAKAIAHRTAATAPSIGRPCMRQPARRPQQLRDLVRQAAVAVEADTQLNIASDVTKLIGASAPLLLPTSEMRHVPVTFGA